MSRPISRRNAMRTAAAGAVITTAGPGSAEQTALHEPGAKPAEWRNRVDGMSYRRLGRTGYMVSEVVMGGNTISPDNNDHVRLAVEMGLNYFDTSHAYGGGASERGYGEVIKNSSMREKVFVNTKVSDFDQSRNKFYWNLFKTLSEEKQKRIQGEVDELIRIRNIKNSRYMGRFGTWQHREIEGAYFSNVMEKYYGDKIDRKKEYYDRIITSVQDSLKRLHTDYVDLFMCPHGANSPEELMIPEIHEAMDRLRREGKIRAVGLSCHTDPAGVLLRAVRTGKYDAVMIAYNIVNGDFCYPAVREAWENDVGVIAMKVAQPVHPNRKSRWIPPSRIERLHHVVRGDWNLPQKAYLWALQNPYIACVNSDMTCEDHVRDNLPVAGVNINLVPLEDPEKFTE